MYKLKCIDKWARRAATIPGFIVRFYCKGFPTLEETIRARMRLIKLRLGI